MTTVEISRKRLITVIPAKAGIQESQIIVKVLDAARSGVFTGVTIF